MFIIISFDLNSLRFLKDNKERDGSHFSTQVCTAFVGETLIRGTRTRLRHYPCVIKISVNPGQTSGEAKLVLYEGYAKNFRGH